MSDFATTLLKSTKLNLRETSNDFDEEILSYIDACAVELQGAGILPTYFDKSSEIDPQIRQAVYLYCRSHYGLYNADSEKYQKSYESLKALLCTNRKYTEVNNGI